MMGGAGSSRDMTKQRTGHVAFGSEDALERIAIALERLAPQVMESPDYCAADAFSWHPDQRRLSPVARVNRVEMSLLKGIDRMRDKLVEKTDRLPRGLPANNALLWGARGMGKSSLVKGVHSSISVAQGSGERAEHVLRLVV